MSQTIKGSMTAGNPTRALIAFVLPMICGNLFQQFYNIVDSIIVGKFVGESALAAVGASVAITGLFVFVANGSGTGCSIVISNLFGARDIKNMKTAIYTALSSILCFSLLLSALGLVISRPLLLLMGTPSNVLEDAAAYMNIYFLGFAFLFLYNVLAAVFNALGDSTRPLLFLIFSSFLNVGLDLLFVIRFHMGVRGAAWATLIAQAASAMLAFGFLMYKLRAMPCEPFARFDSHLLKRMTRVAIPTILQQSIVSVGRLLIQSTVNPFGSTFLAGYTAAIKLESIAMAPITSVGLATSTYVAQNIGAGKPERIPRGYVSCLCISVSIALVIAGIMHFCGESMVGWFLDAATSQAAISIGFRYLSIVSRFYFVMSIMNVGYGLLRGSGDMRWFLIACLCNLSTRVVLCHALAQPTGGEIIMWANQIGWFVGLCITVGRYFQGGWKRVRV